MKLSLPRSVLALLAALAITACSQEETAQEDGIFPYPMEKSELDNGLKVVTVPYNSPGIAAFYIVVRVGSRHEVEEGKTGFAHFFEHMMFRGTDMYPKEKYSEVLKSIGAAANANTSFDRTLYHMTGNAEMLEKMFELESDRFMNLNYSEDEFKVEAGAVKGEYTKNYASPFMKLYEKTQGTAYQEHTYKHTVIGFWDDVVDMPNQYQYSLQFFDRYYRPEYTTILVVGDVESTQVNALAEKYFGSWERGSFVQTIPEEPQQEEVRFAHVQAPNFPPVLSLNYKGPAFSVESMDMQALDVIGTLAFGEKSDIYKKLVVEERKVRQLNAGGYDMADPGLWSVDAVLVDKEDMVSVKQEIDKVLEELKTSPVDETLLSETKSNMKYNFAMRLDNPDAIANSLAHYIWLLDDPNAVNKTYENYDAVTAEVIMQVAQKYFTNNTLTISTISPDEKFEEPDINLAL